VLGGTLACVAACTGLLDVPLPPGTVDPGVLASVEGALAIRSEALIALNRNYGGQRGDYGITLGSGVLTDEFITGGVGFRFGDPNSPFAGDVVDRRVMTGASGDLTNQLSGVVQFRQYAILAVAAIRANHNPGYGPLVAQMFYLQGFAELLIAENFCSGVSLSDVVPGGDLLYGSPLTTQEMFTRAAADFDSALVQLADPSIAPAATDTAGLTLATRVRYAAKIGKARALLGLGDFARVAELTADVPDDYVYALQYDGASNVNVYQVNSFFPFTVPDREGGNGLPFRSANDPRLPIVNTGMTYLFDDADTIYIPAKYNINGSSPIPIASGIEARLIEAEAALGDDDPVTWLARINHLRETMISPSMADTTDPGTPDGRLSLTFYERGFWLFGTGHRLGDLRRLVKVYGKSANAVFPSGPYVAGAIPSMGFGPNYGTDIGFTVPASELQYNPNARACPSGT
jgi:hypothetical protein